MTQGRHRPGLVTIALAAIAVLAVVLAVTAVGSPSAAPAVATRTVTVGRGVVQQTVSGSGNLEPGGQANLDFSTSGELTHLYVSVGSHVVEGQLLAQIDPSEQQVALAQAQASLQSAQDALDAAQTAATAATAATTTTTPAARGGASQTGQAGGGSSTLSVAAATADVESAQLAVTSAQQALDATKLFAPMPGTVTAINGAVGDAVGPSGSQGASSDASSSSSSSPGASIARGLGGGGGSSSASSSSQSSSALIVLSQLSHLTLDVSLTEADVGKVHVGQPATVTVDATGDELAGHVKSVGLLPSSSGGSSGAVSYPVTIAVDQSSSTVRAGMSASASIVTAQASGLVVPSQAITAGSVTVSRDGKNVSQTVTTGLVGDSSTQVIGGVDDGEQLVVRSTTASATSSTTGSGATAFPGAAGGLARGGFGGGGFGGGGGGGGGVGRLRALAGGGG
jgi:membrane fusion protein, macrolide-specific efflux system